MNRKKESVFDTSTSLTLNLTFVLPQSCFLNLEGRTEGADYVVVMAHMGNEEEVSPWMYTDVISHTTGIDAWLDGHSHDAEQVVMKNKDGQNVYRSACGTKNANIGVLTISADGSLSTELYSWSAGISAPKLLGLSNPATEKVAEAADTLDQSMNAVIARTASDLIINEPGAKMRDGKPVRIIQTTETNLGDLCADAYLNHFEGADIAIVNGDGIRADISRGDITMNDIMKTLPYGTKLDLVKIGTVLLFLSPCFMETGGQKQKDRPVTKEDYLCWPNIPRWVGTAGTVSEQRLPKQMSTGMRSICPIN